MPFKVSHKFTKNINKFQIGHKIHDFPAKLKTVLENWSAQL